MKTLGKPLLIKERAEELLYLERKQSRARFRDYVRYLRYLKTGAAMSQVECGHLIGLQARQSQTLWHRYKKEGLSNLLTEQRQGSIGQLSYVQISHLQSFLRRVKQP